MRDLNQQRDIYQLIKRNRTQLLCFSFGLSLAKGQLELPPVVKPRGHAVQTTKK